MDKDIIRILNTCKRINVKNCDPWPDKANNGELIYLVGLTNVDWPGSPDRFECHQIYYPKYCKRLGKNDLTYGGYHYLDKEGEPKHWWTFNYVYGDENNKEWAYIVDNEKDGEKLAKFLTEINGYFTTDSIFIKISNINDRIKNLQKELEYYQTFYEDLKKYIGENNG